MSEKSCNLSRKNINSLKGLAPEKCENFYCYDNPNLKSLEGGPRIVENVYNCSACALKNLEGAPERCKNFYCDSNPNLKTLKGGPKEVENIYNCSSCSLEDLEGAPEKCKNFYCYSNPNLKSLKGAPRVVEGDFECSDCDLQTLEGAPKKCKNFYCYDNMNLKIKNILNQKDFKKFFENIKNYEKINGDEEVEEFLNFLKELSMKNIKPDKKKIKFLWDMRKNKNG